MLNKESTPFTFGFAIVLTLVCSLILGGASQGLKKKQNINAEIDVKSKVLQALDLFDAIKGQPTTNDIVLNYFKEAGHGGASIEKLVVDGKGTLLTLPAKALAIIELKSEAKKEEAERRYPLYVYYGTEKAKAAKKADAYILPIQGVGLWSLCEGFLALEADATTIKGIIYYKHAETPGLGAEIKDNAKWVAQFSEGKSIINAKGELQPPQSTKDMEKAKGPHAYWAINGATFTLNGVNTMLTEYCGIYNNYLKTKRGTTLVEKAKTLVKEIK